MDINPESSKARQTSRVSGRRATLKEVAAEVGVSRATVSNAYNRPDQLSEELRVRVFEAARRLGYAGPDPTARGLRKQRTGAIGALYTDRLSYAFADPAAVMFFEGVSVATEEAGLGLLLIPGGSLGQRDPEILMSAAVDGFVIFCMAEDDPLVEATLRRQMPAVLVDQPPIEGVPSIGIDDEAAARLAAEHLTSLGHRSFGVVSFDLDKDSKSGFADIDKQHAATYLPNCARLRGYESALEAAGISWADVPVYECAENVPGMAAEAAEALLALAPRPTAIIATSDQLAFGFMEAVKKAGLSIPEDISVVGFDDVPEAARANPPLTTIHQPHVEKGLRAGRMLIAQLREEEPPETQVLLPTRLVVRGSAARTDH